MILPPAYFEQIHQQAAARWVQLENDPELAAPWWQLFKQVQSPRHIVSELLQNADDAGASEATVRINENVFIFEHNGEDFTKEHFASLCKFGYSNKRALHTIGFRGIGFKSTFSLGKRVELYTPTLAVAFDQDRFTEPQWVNDHIGVSQFTKVRVVTEDKHRIVEVEKNLQDWLKSPVSLLFFKNIRKIQIGEAELHWGSYGPGPVADTEWLALHENADETFLIARSGLETFPEDALDEIKQERMLSVGEQPDFPPCSIEIVLGVEGRLYVVLPTGVKTNLPFACNAPFIQDPARMKIKDPETSPTNRWLLERAGKLAAEVMLKWLCQTELDPSERARAYNLMPDVDHDDNSLEGTCGTIVEKAFAETIEGKYFLLTDETDLTASKQSIIVPRQIFDVWPGKQAAALLDDDDRPTLSRYVSNQNRTKLINWDVIEEFDDEDVLDALQNRHFPKPDSWRNLLNLWTYIEPLISGYQYYGRETELNILPVQGKEILCSAAETVRLGEKKLLPSEDDWKFLGERLSVLNQNWLRYLTEQRRLAEINADNIRAGEVEAAYAVLEAISMDAPSDTGKMIDQVAGDFFGQKKVSLSDAIRIAQIAAKLGATVGENFRFACQDMHLHSINKTILFDENGNLDLLLPEEWGETHLLHSDYFRTFTSCTREEWLQWVSSGRSGLHTFVPLQQTRKNIYGKKQIEEAARKRGYQGELSYPYVTSSFVIEDWDFVATIWDHWENNEGNNDHIWGTVVEQILIQRAGFWNKAQNAKLLHVATTGNTRSMVFDPVLPSWILKLREKECLRDTNGFYHKPAELLLRTPETEALMDVEPFVHGLLDNETTRPLLKLLGVGDVPTGPDKLLARLQTLAQVKNKKTKKKKKWYRRLDRMLDGCSSEDFNAIRRAFSEEKLILTGNGTWETSTSVFLTCDEEDAPGAQTVRASLSDLTMWRKLGVADRPTVDLAINWLKNLPDERPLSQEDLRRVRALLARHPLRIWDECKHWISLSGEWVAIENFSYVMTMQTLVPWSHLHQWVKQKTADLQKLPTEYTEKPPFADLPPLAAHLEERFVGKDQSSGIRQARDWLNKLGEELQRIKLDDDEETSRIRALASDLALTSWQTTDALEIISYIDGKPAGTARQADVFWMDKTLFAKDRSAAKLARVVAQELGRSFRRPDIVDAIKLCFDRPPEFITEYMEENFDLAAPQEIAIIDETRLSPVNEKPVEDEHDKSETDGTQQALPGQDAAAEQDDALEVTGSDIENSSMNDSDVNLDEKDEPTTAQDVVMVPRSAPKPFRPSIMERFALSQGFKKDRDNSFFNDEGCRIAKTNGSLFPWEQVSATGEIIRYYWPKKHCLERDPLQLDAAIWSVIEQQPETYVLVLLSLNDQPVEISGTKLCEMRKQGIIALHPATYRLVFENDE